MRLPSVGGLRGFDRSVYLVAGARFVNTFGSGVVYPFATLYFVQVVGIPFTLVGLGLLANNVATATGTLAGGYLADRYGRRPVMVASMALAAPALAAYALVETAVGFAVVATAAGLALGLFAPASQATIADATASEDRDRAYGLLKIASNAGFGSGFVAGGVLFELARTAVFVVDGATSAVVAALLWVALPRTFESDATDDAEPSAETGAGGVAALRATLWEWRDAVEDRTVLALALLNVGFAVMYAQMQSTVPVFAESRLGLSSGQLGTLYVLNPLVIVLFQLPAVDRVEGWRRTRGLMLSAGFWAASFVALLLVTPAPPLVGVALVGAFLVLRTVGEILHSPLITAIASEVGAADERGSQLSVLEVAKRLGFGLGPVVGGAFFDAGAANLLWVVLLVGCLALAGGLLALETGLPASVNARTTDGNAPED
ncbi:MFS transporter [Halobacteriales archaeon SW_12_71_31]|nr:MAG: MFS transporter [Halobacteriales archaeon SW_12_71_31]